MSGPHAVGTGTGSGSASPGESSGVGVHATGYSLSTSPEVAHLLLECSECGAALQLRLTVGGASSECSGRWVATPGAGPITTCAVGSGAAQAGVALAIDGAGSHRFGSSGRKEIAAALRVPFMDRGFELEMTGGGCWAWKRNLSWPRLDGYQHLVLLVTDSGGSEVPLVQDSPLLAGLMDVAHWEPAEWCGAQDASGVREFANLQDFLDHYDAIYARFAV